MQESQGGNFFRAAKMFQNSYHSFMHKQATFVNKIYDPAVSSGFIALAKPRNNLKIASLKTVFFWSGNKSYHLQLGSYEYVPRTTSITISLTLPRKYATDPQFGDDKPF